MRLILIIIFLINSSSVFSLNDSLSHLILEGKIVANRQKINDAVVTLEKNGDLRQIKVNQKGKFTLDLTNEVDNYVLVIKKDGFCTKKLDISLKGIRDLSTYPIEYFYFNAVLDTSDCERYGQFYLYINSKKRKFLITQTPMNSLKSNSKLTKAEWVVIKNSKTYKSRHTRNQSWYFDDKQKKKKIKKDKVLIKELRNEFKGESKKAILHYYDGLQHEKYTAYMSKRSFRKAYFLSKTLSFKKALHNKVI